MGKISPWAKNYSNTIVFNKGVTKNGFPGGKYHSGFQIGVDKREGLNFSKNKSTYYSPFQTWLYNSDFCRILPLNHYIFSMLGTLSKRGLLFIGLISLWGTYVFKLFYRAVIKWDFSKSWVLSKGRQINFFFLKWDFKT